MGTGKTFIAAGAALMAGFKRILVLCPPHLTRKWKREVEATVPGATRRHRDLHHRPGAPAALRGLRPPLRRDVQRAGEAVLPLDARRSQAVGRVGRQAHKGRGDGRALPGPLLPRLRRAARGQGRRAPHRRGPVPQEARSCRRRRAPPGGARPTAARPCGRPTPPAPAGTLSPTT